MEEKMVIITQCAGSKNNRECGFFKIEDTKKVEFVADPNLVPEERKKEDLIFVHPDDKICKDKILTYREALVEYNRKRKMENPYNLCDALSLYKPRIYKRLKKLNKNIPVYILSAGWGLVRGSFLLPLYDITLKANNAEEKYKIRKYSKKSFNDFNHLREDWRELNLDEYKIYVFVGRNYLDLLYNLLYNLMKEEINIGENQITIFHRSNNIEKKSLIISE
jgi:hypothetical protein